MNKHEYNTSCIAIASDSEAVLLLLAILADWHDKVQIFVFPLRRNIQNHFRVLADAEWLNDYAERYLHYDKRLQETLVHQRAHKIGNHTTTSATVIRTERKRRPPYITFYMRMPHTFEKNRQDTRSISIPAE